MDVSLLLVGIFLGVVCAALTNYLAECWYSWKLRKIAEEDAEYLEWYNTRGVNK